ncbi:MAG: AAA family ATPase [Solirubrobacteraceae bacterium]
MTGGRTLLERGEEQAILDAALVSARGGEGALVLIEGPAGIGKTALLGSLAARAAAAGMTHLVARGAQLERDFALGALRRLFAPVVGSGSGAPDGDHERIARELVRSGRPGAPVADEWAVLDGFFSLAADLAGEHGAVLVVDDAQWIDAPSLRFLAFLAARLTGLRLLLAVGRRTGEPDEPPLIGHLAADPDVRVVRPRELSAPAIADLVAERLDVRDRELAVAVHEATGGNPFLGPSRTVNG